MTPKRAGDVVATIGTAAVRDLVAPAPRAGRGNPPARPPEAGYCGTMSGGADRERLLAERERRLAEEERQHLDRWDRRRMAHLRAMHSHERSAEIHDALAELHAAGDHADAVEQWLRRVTFVGSRPASKTR